MENKTILVVQYLDGSDKPFKTNVSILHSSTSGTKWIIAKFANNYKFGSSDENGRASYIPAGTLAPMYYNDLNECWKFGSPEDMPSELQEKTKNEKLLDIDNEELPVA